MLRAVKAAEPTLALADNFKGFLSIKSGRLPDLIFKECRRLLGLPKGESTLGVNPIVIKGLYILCLCLLSFIIMPLPIAYGAGMVEQITVHVTSPAAPLPPRIAKRMEVSVATVGEQVLVGRDERELIANQPAYEKVIQEVFDRVLSGYSVQAVRLAPGRNTKVDIQIKPWGEVVRQVVLELDTGSIPADMVPLLLQDMGNVQDKMEESLLGLPVDSLDWAAGVFKLHTRDMLSEQLPEFRSAMEISGGVRTVVKLALIPAGPTVQDFHVSLRSKSIPNVLLAQIRPVAEKQAVLLNGLPASFVERHRNYFENRIQEAMALQPMAKNYGLSFRTYIDPGRDTDVRVDVETDKYKVSLEGYMDMGKREDNTAFRLHVGQYVTKRDEGFLEVNFIPARMTWEFVPGWGHRIGNTTQVGIKYNHSKEQAIGWMTQQLDRNWQLRVERIPVTGYNEFGLRYKLHDFLSAEYIVGQEESWLRLIGNL